MNGPGMQVFGDQFLCKSIQYEEGKFLIKSISLNDLKHFQLYFLLKYYLLFIDALRESNIDTKDYPNGVNLKYEVKN